MHHKTPKSTLWCCCALHCYLIHLYICKVSNSQVLEWSDRWAIKKWFRSTIFCISKKKKFLDLRSLVQRGKHGNAFVKTKNTLKHMCIYDCAVGCVSVLKVSLRTESGFKINRFPCGIKSAACWCGGQRGSWMFISHRWTPLPPFLPHPRLWSMQRCHRCHKL